MELYQLRSFTVVAEEGHLTRAAERLHVSQPAVSGQIKALEQELGLRLFERSASGMVLTVAGKELLATAQRVLTAAEDMKQKARRLTGEIAGVLRVGTVSNPASLRVGDLLAAVVERHPRLQLELQHEVSGVALEAVREGRLDASFYFGDAPGRDVVALRLRDPVYCVAAPAAWADRIRSAGWAEIAAMPWILTPATSTHNRLVTRLFEEQGIAPPQRAVEADQESVIETLVVSGVGVSLLREELAKELAAAGEICIWDKARLRTTLWFVCAAGREEDPLLAALFSLLREIWQLPGEGAARPAAALAV
ncbi:MAG: LysR family transcriptional regulator [Burkholderiales bacterium]|jgi:DNA-binding transcriptional LysR family regulator|nr:LysR family transcriptional regulator [Burkholderiales bacterium]